jgi:response regulator NasT
VKHLTPHVLIVDDDRLVLVTLAAGLRAHGFATSAAADANEGMRLVAEANPDLVLLDQRMPGETGLEMAVRLREREIPFVFLSAYGEAELVAEASRAGALGYLVKPMDIAQIVPPIRAALARAAEIRTLRNSEQQLSHALSGGRATSTAVGILMERNNLPSTAAFELLRGHARAQRRRVEEIATEVVCAADNLASVAPAHSVKRG